MNKHFLLAVCAVCLLSACGGSPTATLSLTNLTFAKQDVGTTSAAQSVTLSNSGSATLNIDNIATTANFEQNNTCGASVRAGANCTISVTFTPPDAGDFTGRLSITDNANVSPQTVSLSGTGISPPPFPGHCVYVCPSDRCPELTGSCSIVGRGVCRQVQDPVHCPVGQPAQNPETDSCGVSVDFSRPCQ